jgi:hypothetical protein
MGRNTTHHGNLAFNQICFCHAFLKTNIWPPNLCITSYFMVTVLFLIYCTQQYLVLSTTMTKWGGRLALRCNFTCVLNPAKHVYTICTHIQLACSLSCIHGYVKVSDIPDYSFWFLDKNFTVPIVLSPAKTSFFSEHSSYYFMFAKGLHQLPNCRLVTLLWTVTSSWTVPLTWSSIIIIFQYNIFLFVSTEKHRLPTANYEYAPSFRTMFTKPLLLSP